MKLAHRSEAIRNGKHRGVALGVNNVSIEGTLMQFKTVGVNPVPGMQAVAVLLTPWTRSPDGEQRILVVSHQVWTTLN